MGSVMYAFRKAAGMYIDSIAPEISESGAEGILNSEELRIAEARISALRKARNSDIARSIDRLFGGRVNN